MSDKEHEFIHDLINKLTAMDGKIRKIRKCVNTMDILDEVDKIKVYNIESLKLLTEYKKYLREKESN